MKRFRTPIKLYTPKMNIKDVVIKLTNIMNQIAWNQANRETSGNDWYIKIAEELNKLVIEMNKWGTKK